MAGRYISVERLFTGVEIIAPGPLHWRDTQLLYHALAHQGRGAIALTWSREPYVCLGNRQKAAPLLDFRRCKRAHTGIFRREIGGGTVYIDREQLLYQVVVPKEIAPLSPAAIYRKHTGPLLAAYRAFGLKPRLLPPCDITVNGRKISGSGGGEVGRSMVFTSNILLDFEPGRFASFLRLPRRDMRTVVAKSIGAEMNTLRRELGQQPSIREVCAALLDTCRKCHPDAPVLKRIPETTRDAMVALRRRGFGIPVAGSDVAPVKAFSLKVRESVFLAFRPIRGGWLVGRSMEGRFTGSWPFPDTPPNRAAAGRMVGKIFDAREYPAG